MMARGEQGRHSAAKGDYEAFQVARWALGCFKQPAVLMTHPGGRGNWDALPISIRGTDESWTYAYVFQRLLDFATLHHAGHHVPVVDPDIKPLDVPAATRAAISSWGPGNQKLFSYCFRLYRALAQGGN
jgi:hypothetical protein